MKTTIEKKGDFDVLKIEIPLQQPAPSKSGKTLIVASSNGILKTEATVNGKNVSIGLNAFINR